MQWVCGLVWDHQTHLLLSVKPSMNHRSLGWKFALLTPWVTQLPRQRLSAMSNSITKASATRNPNPLIRAGAGKPQTGHINTFQKFVYLLAEAVLLHLVWKEQNWKLFPSLLCQPRACLITWFTSQPHSIVQQFPCHCLVCSFLHALVLGDAHQSRISGHVISLSYRCWERAYNAFYCVWEDETQGMLYPMQHKLK